MPVRRVPPPSLAPAFKIISSNAEQFRISRNPARDKRMHREAPHVQPTMIGVRSQRETVDHPQGNGLKTLSLPSLPHSMHALSGAQGFAAGGASPRRLTNPLHAFIVTCYDKYATHTALLGVCPIGVRDNPRSQVPGRAPGGRGFASLRARHSERVSTPAPAAIGCDREDRFTADM
jgi:hypothetical protein